MSDGEKTLAAVGAIFAAFLLIFMAPVIGVLLGAFSGWVVGLFFADSIMATIAGFGFTATVSMWQLGATLGFVGGFLRVQRRDIKVVGAK